MGNMPVIKDLVVDMSSFWNHLEALSPTLVLVRENPRTRVLQTPEDDRSQTSNCIMCEACYSKYSARKPRFCWSPR